MLGPQSTLVNAGGRNCRNFQRNETTKLGVLGLVDNTHPTATDLLDDVVMRDGLADHLRECYGVRSGMSMYGLTAAAYTPPWLP
jgi:hypothetical protein